MNFCNRALEAKIQVGVKFQLCLSDRYNQVQQQKCFNAKIRLNNLLTGQETNPNKEKVILRLLEAEILIMACWFHPAQKFEITLFCFATRGT